MTLAREMALESEYVMGTFARKPVEFVEGHGMTPVSYTHLYRLKKIKEVLSVQDATDRELAALLTLAYLT